MFNAHNRGHHFTQEAETEVLAGAELMSAVLTPVFRCSTHSRPPVIRRHVALDRRVETLGSERSRHPGREGESGRETRNTRVIRTHAVHRVGLERASRIWLCAGIRHPEKSEQSDAAECH